MHDAARSKLDVSTREELLGHLLDTARSQPDAPAVVTPGGSRSYREVWEDAAGVAELLGPSPVGGGVVALAIRDRYTMLTAVLGSLQAGWVWMPVNPSQPLERTQRSLDVVPPDLLVCDESCAVMWPDAAMLRRRGRLVALQGSGDDRRWERMPLLGPTADAAYVCSTSGSTGIPKAIVGSLRSLVAFIEWEISQLDVTPGMRFSQLTPPTFDAYLRDVFVPLYAGGTVCLPGVDHPLLAKELAEWIDVTEINVLHTVPSIMRTISGEVDSDAWPSLRYVAVAGEPVLGADVIAWRPLRERGVQVLNLYGSTETTMVKTFHLVTSADEDAAVVPLGRPMPGTTVRLSEEAGQVGEIIIDTQYPSLGYYGGDPTGGRFERCSDGGGATWSYRTGDYARLGDRGELRFLGRRDGLIKVRGVRVELGEVEASIRRCAGVRDVAVVPITTEVHGQEMVACVTGRIDTATVTRWCASSLPAELRPTRAVILPDLPLTSHGKVDRAALAHVVKCSPAASPTVVRGGSLIERLAAVWGDVLGVKVGPDDNFFDLGGNSLMMVKVAARMRRDLGIEVSLALLFETLNVSALAHRLEEADGEHSDVLVQLSADSAGRALHCVHAAGGMAVAYSELAKALEGRLTVHGLQAVGIESDTAPDESVEEMAERYVRAVRHEQPVGPYALLGWSGGGAIVLEMAARISEAGETVDAVFLLDPAAPGYYEESEDEISMLAELLGELGAPITDAAFRELADTPSGARLQYLLDTARRRGVSLMDLEDAQRLVAVHRAHVHARRRYRGRPFEGRMTLIQPSESPRRSDGPSLSAWKRLALGGLQVHTVVGHHSLMVRQPTLEAVAAIITDTMEVEEVEPSCVRAS